LSNRFCQFTQSLSSQGAVYLPSCLCRGGFSQPFVNTE
jgi:hypothetical protein